MNAAMNNIYYNPGTHTTHYETDYVQECLVERENQDIMQKYLRGEQLTEEESKTVSDCATEKKESENTAMLITVIIIGVVVLALIIFLIVNAVRGY
jgi:hypothetical protein